MGGERPSRRRLQRPGTGQLQRRRTGGQGQIILEVESIGSSDGVMGDESRETG